MSEEMSEPHDPSHDEPDERGDASAAWRRTLIVVWIAEFFALIGFALVMPFLPFYVEELGVRGDSQIKFWSGLLLGAQPVTMAIFAPIWGSVADRHGRKLMLERALFGSAVVMGLMGLAQNPQQLLILRIIQGCLTGTVPAATTLVASVVPKDRTGFALGWLQMGIYAGVSVGPLVGGVTADMLGYRTSFYFTGACLFTGGLGVLFFVKENFKPPEPQPGEDKARWWDGLVMVVRTRKLLTVMTVRLLTRGGVRVISPVLPLFVAALLPGSDRVATMAGIVSGASALASSVGSVVLGRTGDHVGYRRVLLISAIAAAIFYALQAAVTNVNQLILLQFCVGLALSGTISSLTALLATLAPEGKQGAVYGTDTSIVSGANALGPTLGASLAILLGNRATFLLAAGIFVIAAFVIVWFVPQDEKVEEKRQESPSKGKLAPGAASGCRSR